MDITNTEDLMEGITSIIDFLSSRDDDFYVALELTHQLRDELLQVIPDDDE